MAETLTKVEDDLGTLGLVGSKYLTAEEPRWSGTPIGDKLRTCSLSPARIQRDVQSTFHNVRYLIYALLAILP